MAGPQNRATRAGGQNECADHARMLAQSCEGARHVDEDLSVLLLLQRRRIVEPWVDISHGAELQRHPGQARLTWTL